MFEVFGNMDSVEEINACAAGLLEEGDTERISDLARENGIPEFFVENYVSGGEELTDCMNAAIGKLGMEAKSHKDKYVPAEPVADYLKSLCIEERFARRVRRRTKSLDKCLEYVEKRTGELVRKGITNCPDLTVFHWARDYYLEDGEE